MKGLFVGVSWMGEAVDAMAKPRAWKGDCISKPGAFPSGPFMEMMADCGFPYSIKEMQINYPFPC